jgi:hypothetical protein
MASGNGVDGNGIPGSKPNPDLKIYVSSDMDTVHRNDEFKVTLNFTNIGKSKDYPITKIKMVSEIPNGLVNTTNLYLDDKKRFRDGFFDDKNYIRIETETNLKKGESLLIYYNATINKSNRRKYPEHIPLIKIDDHDITFFFKDEDEARPDESMITVDSIKLENAKPKIEAFDIFHDPDEEDPLSQSDESDYTLCKDATIYFSIRINDSDDDNLNYTIYNIKNASEGGRTLFNKPHVVTREEFKPKNPGYYKFKLIANDTYDENETINETVYEVSNKSRTDVEAMIAEKNIDAIKQQYKETAIKNSMSMFIIFLITTGLIIYIYIWREIPNNYVGSKRRKLMSTECKRLSNRVFILGIVLIIMIIMALLIDYTIFNIHIYQLILLTSIMIISIYLFCLSGSFAVRDCMLWATLIIITFTILYYFLPELISTGILTHTYNKVILKFPPPTIMVLILSGLIGLEILHLLGKLDRNKLIIYLTLIIISLTLIYIFLFICYEDILLDIQFDTKQEVVTILISESTWLLSVADSALLFKYNYPKLRR